MPQCSLLKTNWGLLLHLLIIFHKHLGTLCQALCQTCPPRRMPVPTWELEARGRDEGLGQGQGQGRLPEEGREGSLSRLRFERHTDPVFS